MSSLSQCGSPHTNLNIALLRRLFLASWLLLADAAGLALGFIAPEFSSRLGFLSDLFLRLIRSIIAPVLVGALIRAIAGASSLGNLGRLRS